LEFGAFSVEGVYELLNTGRVLLFTARGFEIERARLPEPLVRGTKRRLRAHISCVAAL
jgi:hypothetical protein